MNEYLKSGRQALRLLYFLIISLSITNSIKLLFTVDNKFILPATERIILFAVFLSFITRFFLGAYRVLSEDIEIELRRPKIITDVFAFFIQALTFYVYSLNYYDLLFAQWIIVFICLVDLIWLGTLASCFKIRPTTFREWMVNNIVLIIILPCNIFGN
jgi:hypothetical protein